MLPFVFRTPNLRKVLYLNYQCCKNYCTKKTDAEIDRDAAPPPEKPETFWDYFLPRGITSVDMISLLHQKEAFSDAEIAKRIKERILSKTIASQKYNPERHKILGANLATAHFLVAQGGAVKLSDKSEWIRKDEKGKYTLPGRFVPNLYVEEIDMSNTEFMYEGFENLVHLYYLKSLNFRNCKHMDDWCLDRFHIFTQSPLEHLDLSGCEQITERGLCSLHKLRNLKTLVIEDLPNIKHKALISILLEDHIPGCKVIGVDYMKHPGEL